MALSMRKKLLGGIGITLIATASYSYGADSPAAGERCVPIKDIRRTEVVDNENILFHLRNKKVYNNHLPHRCGGLAAGNAFQYETSQSELCNTDIIRVVNSTTGELLPGASCGLGLFTPVDIKPKTEKISKTDKP